MQSQTKVVHFFLISSIYHVICGYPTNDGDAIDGNDGDVIDLSTFGLNFGQPDMKTGDLVKSWQPTDESNPEELGSYLEGDILFPMNHSTNSRNGMVAQSYRWTNAVIPFEIVGSFDPRSLNNIENAMNVYHKQTCIQFQRRTGKERDYIS